VLPESRHPEREEQPSLHDRGIHRLSYGDLKRKTGGAVLWTAAQIGSDQVFAFVIFIILARILTPEDFGVFALAAIFSEIGRIIATAGLVQAVARSKTVTSELADTVFWSNLGLSTILAAAGLLLAPGIASLVGAPTAAAPLAALALTLPVGAVGATHMTLRLREFGHRSMTVRSIFAGVLGGGAAVGAAIAGWGLWSLVVQRAVTSVVSSAVAWSAYRWVPGRQFSWAALRGVSSFGFDLMLSQILVLALVRVQDIIVGRYIGASAVGIYRTAWRTNEFIAAATIRPFSTVALQTFSRLQTDRALLDAAHHRMLSISAVLAFPALIGFGALAPELVPLIYGARWAESGPLAQVFCLMAVPFTLNFFAGPALSAVGQSASIRWMVTVQLALTTVLSLAVVRFGLMAVAAAYVLRAYLTVPLQMWMLKRSSGIDPLNTLRTVASPLIASAIMAGVVLLAKSQITPLLPGAVLRLTILVGIGVVTYLVLLALLEPKLLRDFVSALRTLRTSSEQARGEPVA
jgi:O-antigen/teichoic acid export membrane protein